MLTRLQLCEIDPKNGGKFDCVSAINLQPYLGTQSLPCNLRMYPEQEILSNPLSSPLL